jgi:transcriptional regulator with XRE-family HTH domain
MLRWARRRSGLTQRQLASVSGIAQPSISRIERDLLSPQVETLERLLEATGHGLEVGPALGAGVDRSLIRSSLRATPLERLIATGEGGRWMETLRRAERLDR